MSKQLAKLSARKNPTDSGYVIPGQRDPRVERRT
jgi:hypothetical protein